MVGCKLDLRDEEQIADLEQAMSPIMQQFGEIETCIECSAMRNIQVGSLITLFRWDLTSDGFLCHFLASIVAPINCEIVELLCLLKVQYIVEDAFTLDH